jgi:hypothetical protein
MTDHHGYVWLSPDGVEHWQPDDRRPCATCGRAAHPLPCQCRGGPPCGCPECDCDDCQIVEPWPCGWLVAHAATTGETIVTQCEAPARQTDTGWQCEAGHEHVGAWL